MLSACRGFKLPGWAGLKNPVTHGYTVRDNVTVVAGLSGAGRHSRPAAADVAPPPGRLTRCQASEKQ